MGVPLRPRATPRRPPRSCAWNTRFRHLTVLFGDAGAAVVVKAQEGDRGVLDHDLHADGADYDKLYVPGTGFKHRPYVDADQFARGDHIPVMDGRYVFKMATTQHDRGGAGGPEAERRGRWTTSSWC